MLERLDALLDGLRHLSTVVRMVLPSTSGGILLLPLGFARLRHILISKEISKAHRPLHSRMLAETTRKTP